MELIKKYFTLTPVQEKQFAALQYLYNYWNARINVISRKDMDNLYERHVLHSLSIAKVIQFRDHTSILDVGTGGGFPGIPLAILFPACDFVLVDSIGKKIKVVEEVVEELELKNVNAYQTRAEKVDEEFDFIVSRAVTNLPEFYAWVRNKIKKKSANSLPNGILYLKGGEVERELKLIQLKSRTHLKSDTQHPISYKIFELGEYFKEEFFEAKKVVHLCNTGSTN